MQLIPEQIGLVAFKELHRKQHATILGITSKGIFLLTENQRVLFITAEPFASSLTINLKKIPQALKDLAAGEPVTIGNGRIFFTSLGSTIDISRSQVWKPPRRKTARRILNEVKERAILIAEHLSCNKVSSEMASLLLPILSIDERTTLTSHQQTQLEHIRAFRNAFHFGDLNAAMNAIIPFIGAGRGLTPSGDDFVCGLLLALNRWKSVLQTRIDLYKFNRQIIDHTCKNTTTLSANLIEMAAYGQADERLIAMADYLMTGKGEPTELVPKILSYGSSSGVDALVGMVSGLSS